MEPGLERRRTVGAWPSGLILVALTTLLFYANTLPNGYSYDSVAIVERNPMVNDPGQWVTLWTVDHWYQDAGGTANRDLLYRPVALLSYRVVHALFGSNPLPQHLLNLLLHATAGVLVVLLSRSVGASDRAAVLAGLLFAVLPIHTEVVDDIVGRSDLFATVGVLAALLAHRRSTAISQAAGRCAWSLLAAVLVFVAMGAKESGVAAIPLVVMFDWYWCRQRPDKERPVSHRCLRALGRVAYLVVPFALYIGLRYFALGGRLHQAPAVSKTINVLVDAPLWQHAIGVMQLWGMYWYKTFVPVTLCVDYSVTTVRLASNVFDPFVIIGVLAGGLLVIGSIRMWRQGRRWFAICVVALMICYAPTANAIVLIQVFFAERIWYLPSVFVCILLGGVVDRPTRRRLGMALFGLVILAMGARCWLRNPEWASNETVAAAAYRDHPNSVATLVMYGNLLVTRGDIDEGIGLLRRAIEVDLGFTVAHRLLGRAYGLAGDDARSLHHWRIAEMQFPSHRETQAALETLRQKFVLASSDELATLKETADRSPDDLDAELAYVKRLVDVAAFASALERFELAEPRFSHSARWQHEYATTLLFSGRKDDAIRRMQRAVELSPDNVSMHVECAALLMERQTQGDMEAADVFIRRAEALDANAVFTRVLRAEWLALRGDLVAAREIYRLVLESIPEDHPQRAVWKARRNLLGKD